MFAIDFLSIRNQYHAIIILNQSDGNGNEDRDQDGDNDKLRKRMLTAMINIIPACYIICPIILVHIIIFICTANSNRFCQDLYKRGPGMSSSNDDSIVLNEIITL